MENMQKKVVVAGQLCLDITPLFRVTKAKKLEEILVPGKLINVDEANIHLGGCVSNTGLAMKKFGADVVFMAKVGDDPFGRIVQEQMKEYGISSGIVTSPDGATSYSVVLALPGIDRMFLHHSGANDTYYAEDIDFETVSKADLFHFGYPPIMRSMYINDGKEFVRLLQEVHKTGVPISVDMAMADSSFEESRACNWKNVLEQIAPLVDFFVPSVEELLLMMDAGKYEALTAKAEEQGKDITEILSIEQDVKPLAKQLLAWGAKVVFIKCGAPGIFLMTGDQERIAQIRCLSGEQKKSWVNAEIYERSYKPDRFASATGAGDTSIAAFLSGILSGYDPAKCMQLATATGASCVEAYDSLSGLRSFAQIEEKIAQGWEKQNF